MPDFHPRGELRVGFPNKAPHGHAEVRLDAAAERERALREGQVMANYQNMSNVSPELNFLEIHGPDGFISYADVLRMLNAQASGGRSSGAPMARRRRMTMSEHFDNISRELDFMEAENVLPVGSVVTTSTTLGVAPAGLAYIRREAAAMQAEIARLRGKCNRLTAALDLLQASEGSR